MLPVHVQMEKINIAGRPVIHLYADSSPYGSMVYYHGWGSSAESSIFRGGIFASYGFDTYLPDAPTMDKGRVRTWILERTSPGEP